MRGACGSGCRRKMGSSCGQMASICAARLRTIDSSAISFACGLLGFMAPSLIGPGARGAVFGGQQREKIRQRLTRLVLEAVLQDFQAVDPVEAEVAEAIAHLAPGGERPALSPVGEPQRMDDALAAALGLVDIVEARLALLADGASEGLQPGAQALADVEVGRHQR